ncbi:hypothetical protein NQ315_014760 [Exocentrus adspersus]|uniref:DDE Tnp4 domain-containing protein n=1 Tax=Exocentrus adspersus TaxID=1586481 RepID=A0AAV8VLZ2_9CUCU|nr:hypothetical protein NQ315_014760 [Exocentrus adspersus]
MDNYELDELVNILEEEIQRRNNRNLHKSVGKDFVCPLSQPAVSRSLHSVVSAILNQLNQHIKFPQRDEEILDVKNGFYNRFGMPGIIGAIDCTHLSIVSPSRNGPNPRLIFLNRKNFFSLNCQIICDSNLKILNLNARFPGSVHDAAIWSLSDVRLLLKRKYQAGGRDFLLLGDSAYPLRPYLMTPILHALPGTPESQYTDTHCRARNCVERCIGALKGRFRCLREDRVLHHAPAFAAKILYACGILQNIIKDANVADDEIFEPGETII